MRLYDLAEQYQDLLELMQDEPDNERLKAMLEGMEGAIEEKVENTVKVVKTLEAEAQALDSEIKRLTQRKASVEANVKRLKEHTTDLLEQAGFTKLKGTLFTIWTQDNPPSVQVLDETKIPKRYFVKPAPVLMKKMLLDDWREGKKLPRGVEIHVGRSLRVK